MTLTDPKVNLETPLMDMHVLQTNLKDALEDPGRDQQVDAPGGEHRCEKSQNSSQ